MRGGMIAVERVKRGEEERGRGGATAQQRRSSSRSIERVREVRRALEGREEKKKGNRVEKLRRAPLPALHQKCSALSLSHTHKTSVGPAVASPTASPARLFQRPAQETSGSVDRVQETGAGGQRRADGQGEDRSFEELDMPLAGVVAGGCRFGLF